MWPSPPESVCGSSRLPFELVVGGQEKRLVEFARHTTGGDRWLGAGCQPVSTTPAPKPAEFSTVE